MACWYLHRACQMCVFLDGGIQVKQGVDDCACGCRNLHARGRLEKLLANVIKVIKGYWVSFLIPSALEYAVPKSVNGCW